MKYLTTNRALSKNNNFLATASYCELQRTLNYLSPTAYTKGVHGWNCDVYHVGPYVLATGYRTPKGVDMPSDICRELESICNDASAEARQAHLIAALDKLFAA
jgi:hypothetical protein